MIGASVALPAPTERDMTDVFALLADLMPVVSGAAPGQVGGGESRPTTLSGS
jgi:hypothetical protein